MSQISGQTNDTLLAPVLFKDGIDRRKSARVPLQRPVKMGPPGGEPYAVVSASDLSRHGLFIDADRPVKVGARFSTEIELSSGERAYIQEAEVAYNRERTNGAGFGVRFINAEAIELQKIAREIERQLRPERAALPPAPPAPSLILPAPEPEHVEELPSACVVKRKVETVDESATMIPAPSLRLELAREGALAGDGPSELGACDLEREWAERDLTPLAPSLVDDTPRDARWLDGTRELLEDTMAKLNRGRERMLEEARRLPRLWIAVGATGALTVLAAAALTLLDPADQALEAKAPPAGEAGVEPDTQRALMGDQPFTTALSAEPAPATPAAPVKPLPPLVLVDAAPPAAPEPAAVEQPRERRAAPAAKDKSEPTPAKEKAEPAPRAKGTPAGRLRIGVAPRARVLKTHVLKAPHRFVIDLVGQDAAPALPAAGRGVKGLRYGKHAEFARLVIDTDGPISQGKVEKQGKDLVVTLDYTK